MSNTMNSKAGARIVDQWGSPIDRGALKEPQTSRIANIANQWLTSNVDGLTPKRLATTLRNADSGDLTAQARLFADMEERDGHLAAEMNKRKLALLGLDWTIVPPRGATAAEKANAEWLTEVLADAVVPIEDLILALMDAVGHGFAPVELEWRQEGNELLPSFTPQPQEWFKLDRQRRQINLCDNSPDGAPLQAFGWVFHTHGKPKTGYAARLGLHRLLSWPFLYKSYALGDFAEFLETFGLPMIVGKYYSGASAEDKNSLFRAVADLGHNARAIMPTEMQLEIQKITGGGEGSQHMLMVDWADRCQSKVILGQTMSAEAKAGGLGSGNADLHKEVRRDILLADAREIAGTITRDLLYSLLALNRGNVDSLRRCPRFSFDTGEPEDLKLFADSLPKLVSVGVDIPEGWVHDKLRIPVRAKGERVLTSTTPPKPPEPQENPAALGALSANDKTEIGQDALADLAGLMSDEWEESMTPLVSPIERLAEECTSMEEFQRRLPEVIEQMDSSAVADLIARGLFAAHIAGRALPSKAN